MNKLIWVEGIDGKKVQTDSKMLTFLHWFEERIEELGDTTTVIDSTEGGARIKGTKVLDLENTLEEYCQADISASILKVKNLLSEKPDYDLARLANYLRTVSKSTKRLSKQCKKAANLIRKLLKGGKDPATVLAQLSRIDRALVNEEQNYLPFHYLTHPILSVLSNQASKTRDQAERLRVSQLLYQELHRAFSKGRPLIVDLLDSLTPEKAVDELIPGVQPDENRSITSNMRYP